MRIATYNAENLFSRPKVMLYESWDGRQVLEDYAEMSSLIERDTYDAATKSRLVTLVQRHVKGVLASTSPSSVETVLNTWWACPTATC